MSKAPPRAQRTARMRTASRSKDRRAAGRIQDLRSRCNPSQKDRRTSCKEPAPCGCSAAGTERMVFSFAYRMAVALIFLQRHLRVGISILNEGLFMIFCLMSLTALTGAWCGTSLLMWRLHGENAPQGQPAADLSSLWNAPDVWKGQAGEMQQLRDEVTHLAAEIRSLNKEVQQMRKAISEPVEVPDWALKGTGLLSSAIDLQRSSSTSAWLRRVFWSLFRQPLEDTFVQADASPGYCWPMEQSQSEVLIRLPIEVQPTAITLQYCSKTATPLATVSSAPKDFTVSGLDEEGQGETLLGSFLYSVQEEPTQTFPLQNGITRAFRLLKLSIQNNWGKPTHTCIYRVQVHGKMVET